MAKFRDKRIIEAIQINNNAEEIQAFIGDKGTAIETEHGTLVTLNHDVSSSLAFGSNNAYVIKSVFTGNFCVWDKNTFEAIYEKVD